MLTKPNHRNRSRGTCLARRSRRGLTELLSLPQRKDKNGCIRRKRVISTSAYKTCLRNRVILIGAAGAASLGGRPAASEVRSLFYKERTKMHLRRKKSDSLFN